MVISETPEIAVKTFTVKCFRAIDHIDLCNEYVEGHVKVLKDYGVTSVKSSNPSWMHNPNTYCVVAIRSGEMLGGIRIQKANGNILLPMEEGVSKVDPTVTDEISRNIELGCGEQCGLWNSKDIRGYGISWVLVNASIAILPQLGIKKLYGLASDYSMFLFSPAGFVIQKQFGQNGDFNYPTEKYIARVVSIQDCDTLPTTGKRELDFIKEIRQNHVFKRSLLVNQIKLNLSFQLNVEHA